MHKSERIGEMIKEVIKNPLVERVTINRENYRVIIAIREIREPKDHIYKEALIRTIKMYGFNPFPKYRKIFIDL